MLSIPPCTRSSARPMYLMHFVTSGWDRGLPVWPARQRSPPSHRHRLYSQAARQYCVLAAKVSCQPRLPPPIGAWQWLKALFFFLMAGSALSKVFSFLPRWLHPCCGACAGPGLLVSTSACYIRCTLWHPPPVPILRLRETKTSWMLKREGSWRNFWEEKW